MMDSKKCPTCGIEPHNCLVKTLKEGNTDGIRVSLKIQPDGAMPFLCAVGSDDKDGRLSITAIDLKFCPTCGRRLGAADEEPPHAEAAKRCPFAWNPGGTVGIVCCDACALYLADQCVFVTIAEAML